MYGNTVNATEGLKNKLKSTFGWDDATAYAHIGISGMNGLSDQQENTTPAIWTQIRDWANSHHIARLAYWSVNRDRPCPGGGVTSNCSGISRAPGSSPRSRPASPARPHPKVPPDSGPGGLFFVGVYQGPEGVLLRV